uniref:Bromo domain-containing protein n=1 Tax=Steinernema glaseri TaxID=37863 RepID=A0A1I7ZFB5_9BILA
MLWFSAESIPLDCELQRAVDLTFEAKGEHRDMTSPLEKLREAAKAAKARCGPCPLDIVADANLAEYLPEFFLFRMKDILGSKLDYRIEGNKVIYSYNVTWEEDYRDKEPMVPSERSLNDQKTGSTRKTRTNVYPTTGTLTRRTKKDSKEIVTNNAKKQDEKPKGRHGSTNRRNKRVVRSISVDSKDSKTAEDNEVSLENQEAGKTSALKDKKTKKSRKEDGKGENRPTASRKKVANR